MQVKQVIEVIWALLDLMPVAPFMHPFPCPVCNIHMYIFLTNIFHFGFSSIFYLPLLKPMLKIGFIGSRELNKIPLYYPPKNILQSKKWSNLNLQTINYLRLWPHYNLFNCVQSKFNCVRDGGYPPPHLCEKIIYLHPQVKLNWKHK